MNSQSVGEGFKNPLDSPSNLVLEVTNASKDHAHVMSITESDGVLVFHRSARLDDRANAMLMRNLYAVRKWEESVRRHNSILQTKPESSRFFNGLLQSI